MADFYQEVYAPETKERFINSIELGKYPPRWWERVFEKSYIFESAKQKDLFAFTVPEILEFYKFLDIGTLNPLIIYNVNLTLYAQWALNENLISDGQNHFDVIDYELLSTCINKAKLSKSVLSYDDFMDLIDHKILNAQDAFIFICLFEGIKGKDYKEIVEMKLSDIDMDNKCVQLSTGRNVIVTDKFIEIAIKADNQVEYVSTSNNNFIIKLVPSLRIYKEKSNSSNKDINRSVYAAIVRNIDTIKDLYNVITAKSIKDSGLIYYINKRADKLGISAEELMYSIDNWQDIIDKYNFNTDSRRRWILQYTDYLH